MSSRETMMEAIVVLGAKRQIFAAECDLIETLAIGNSHGEYGFNPQFSRASFNFCSRSQDLKHSYHLYRSLSPRMPRLRDVVLFYSLFSPGFLMETSSSEKYICPAINELFHLGLTYDDPDLRILGAEVEGKLDSMVLNIQGCAHGYIPPDVERNIMRKESGSGEKRAASHMRFNAPAEVHAYFDAILELARARGHRVHVVIPPVHPDYRKACPAPASTLFAPLHETLSAASDHPQPPRLLDLFSDTRFTEADFCDFDHLQPMGRGMQQMSQLIDEWLHPPAANAWRDPAQLLAALR